MIPAKLTIGLQRVGRAGSIFHVDADEIFQLAGMADKLIGQLEARSSVDLQAKLRQFNGYVRIELALIDGVEQPDISCCGTPCLVQVMDVFTEDVERGAYSSFVEAGDDT